MQQTIRHRLKLKKLAVQSFVGREVEFDGSKFKVTSVDGDYFLITDKSGSNKKVPHKVIMDKVDLIKRTLNGAS